MEAIDELTADLGWRETELGLIKVFIQRSDVTARQHEVLAKAAWSLLYAHYEGFSKFCLTVFFDRASKSLECCISLPMKTKEFALSVEIKRMRSLPPGEFLSAVENFADGVGKQKPVFPDVDTKSNLWPSVLEELLDSADIKCPSLDRNRILLNSLVGKRNRIAHGEKSEASVEDYLKLENAVYEVMYEVAFEVDARLRLPPFA